MLALLGCTRTMRARPNLGQFAASTTGKATLGIDAAADHLPHNDPHWGPLDVPDEPPEVITTEEQHGQQEPPSQKPPVWFIQVSYSHAQC